MYWILTLAGKSLSLDLLVRSFYPFIARFVASTIAKEHEVNHQHKVPVIRPGCDRRPGCR